MLTMAWVTAVLSPSNSQAPSTVIQSTVSSMASEVTARTVLSRDIEPSVEVLWYKVVGKSIPGSQIRRLASSTTATAAAPMAQR